MGSLAVQSHFSSLVEAPYDEAFVVMQSVAADPTSDKVNLGLGVYRDDDAQPWTLPSVKKAQAQIQDNHDYLPVAGLPTFVEAARKLLLGDVLEDVKSRLTTVQTIAGSGAIRMGALFLDKAVRPENVWISDPSWASHEQIWENASPRTQRRFYPYFDHKTKSFDLEGMVRTLRRDARPGDIIILQACAHNPTGCDPTQKEWNIIADICEELSIIPFMDIAYQGFASGDDHHDAWAVRHFVGRGTMEVLVAQSFSKSFGLYGHRVGALHILAHDSAAVPAIKSNLLQFISSEYLTPSAWGARIVSTILNDPELTRKWRQDLRKMNARVKSMRAFLFVELTKRGTPGSWRHIIDQIGMFSYTGLTASQVKTMREKHHIYLLSTGRASISGLNSKNVFRVAEAIDQVVRADAGV
ncbi:aspartate aminotransferase [Colletotrichum phormii]|uniref:Aspartate aminotransferase n=1 Tax=Colletotrichum phormii TaxID=359342 RepID=A0AAI9ZBZ7_9PEZI|nr:aspartate aminotransferase [Colletotrichum phormii]KAK1621724.1 aspartate aminotransferase [Colletotrichum phormii]